MNKDYAHQMPLNSLPLPQWTHTYSGAAPLAVILQLAQPAQSLLIPQPVLCRVQQTVTAQHLEHTDNLPFKQTH